MYPLTRFLAKHTKAAVKVEGTKEWMRTADIVDPKVEEYEEGTLGEVQMPAKEDSKNICVYCSESFHVLY